MHTRKTGAGAGGVRHDLTRVVGVAVLILSILGTAVGNVLSTVVYLFWQASRRTPALVEVER